MNIISQSPQNNKYGILNSIQADTNAKLINCCKDFTRIILLKRGQITIDLTNFTCTQPELFFIKPGQYINLHQGSNGTILYYNPHLYAMEIEDHHLVLGGLLFNEATQQFGLKLNEASTKTIDEYIARIDKELDNQDNNQETMIRAEIKQLIITCIRIQRQQGEKNKQRSIQTDFYRFFEKLVEHNFFKYHYVSAYAEMLNISPKSLSKRLSKYAACTPGEIIKRRIILEAKRMLIHTHLSVKEISYKLGYEDPSYFIRFFGKQVNIAPQNYRKYYGLSTIL